MFMAGRAALDRAGPGGGAVIAVAVPTLVAALLLNLAVRALALGPFEVPASALPVLPLVMATLGSVLGPSFGCFMAFRRPDPRAMMKFLLPCAGFAVVGVLIEVARFGAGHRHLGALLFGTSQGVLAIGLALAALLWLLAVDGYWSGARRGEVP
jgi:hypothetical protein